MVSRHTFGAPAFKRGQAIGERYPVIRKLGEGGCGAVYLCKDEKDPERRWAVKLLTNPDDLQRFVREVKVMMRTDHPNVVRVVRKGRHDGGAPYAAMEYCSGGSLREFLDKRGTIDEKEAAAILVQAIEGLKAARTVHRDLKPENLLMERTPRHRKASAEAFDPDEGGVVVKVADFGLAKGQKNTSLELTNTGQVMGTPAYMSPEQCRNTKNVSVKTDIYALGVMFFEMVSGKVPFDASNLYDIMEMQVNHEPRYGRKFSPEAKRILQRCLAKQVGRRYPSLPALQRDLAALAGVEVVSSRRWLRWLLVLIVLGGAAAAAWYWWPQVLEYWERLRSWADW